jgi:hypothetical protein
MKALRVLIVTTFIICPFVVSMTLHEKNEYQNMDYSEHLRLKRQASKAQATTTTTKTTTSITTTKIKSGTPSQTILRDSSNIVFPANNDGLVTTLISSTMGESTKKPPRKSLMVVPDHSMLAKTKELLKKDVIGPPLSQKDELKLPVNRASTSTVTVNPRLLYNPQLFEGDIYGAKMSEVNLDITLRNVVANEFIKVITKSFDLGSISKSSLRPTLSSKWPFKGGHRVFGLNSVLKHSALSLFVPIYSHMFVPCLNLLTFLPRFGTTCALFLMPYAQLF